MRSIASVAGAELGHLAAQSLARRGSRPRRRRSRRIAGRSTRSIPCARPRTANAEMVSASLDYYRAMRDAMTEAGFFSMYANMFSRYLADQEEAQAAPPRPRSIRASCRSCGMRWPRSTQGGYVEALARVAFLLMRKGEPLPLSRLELRQELVVRLRGLPAGHVAARLAPHPRRAGNHRSLRAGAGGRDPARCCSTSMPTASGWSTLLDKLLADRRVQSHGADARAGGDAGPHPQGAGHRGQARRAAPWRAALA